MAHLHQGGLYSNYYLNILASGDENSYYGFGNKTRLLHDKEKKSTLNDYMSKVFRVEYIDHQAERRTRQRKAHMTADDNDEDAVDVRRKPRLIPGAAEAAAAEEGKSVKKATISSSQQLISINERNALNENIFQEKLLVIRKKKLEFESDMNLMSLKREKEFLTEQYLDYKAKNFSHFKAHRKKHKDHKKRESISSFLNDKNRLIMPTSQRSLSSRIPSYKTMNNSVSSNAPNLRRFESGRLEMKTEENHAKENEEVDKEVAFNENKTSSRFVKSAPSRFRTNFSLGLSNGLEALDEFKVDQTYLISRVESEYERQYEDLPDRLKFKTPETFSSYHDKINERFVDQKMLRFPNYLKPKKRPKTTQTLEEYHNSYRKI